MIKANMHEAKTRLSYLVNQVEHSGERVLLCRKGVPVAELVPFKPSAKKKNRLSLHPSLSKITLNYDPMEPLQADELPRAAQ